ATVGRKDQNRLGHTSHLATSLLSKPPVALSSTVGKYAASATPISALAAATRRSAAATSGRRSSRAAGTPGGTSGGGASSGAWSNDSSAGDLPMSTAIACSSCARSTPTSISCALVLASCVSACTTSAREAMPPA